MKKFIDCANLPKAEVVEGINKAFKENDTVIVIFTKKDGSKRTLKGTTQVELIPPSLSSNTSSVKRVMPPHLKTVYDVEVQGFRNIDYNSILSYSFGSDDNEAV